MHSLSVMALMHHVRSLVTLKLSSSAINGLAIAELPKIGTLMYLETLELSFPLELFSGDQDHAEELQDKIGKWIQSCSKLRSLALSDFVSVARMLRTVLDSDHIRLRRLRIQGNTRFMTKEFYDSLNSHTSLRELILNYKPPLDSEFEFQPALLWKLTELRVLSFAWISEDFDDAQISVIPGLHPKLEEFSVIGDGITDRIWDSMATLKGLSKLAIAGFSMFTCKGISEFLDTIGNKPLDLEISAAHRGILGERYDVGKLRERFTALGGSLQILDDVDGRFIL